MKNRNLVVLIEPDLSVRDALNVLLAGEGWQVLCLDNCDGLDDAIRRIDVCHKTQSA